MYFILEKHLKRGYLQQIGIVVADSVEQAAEKLGCDIQEMYPKEASCLGCFILPQGSEYKYIYDYDLEEIKEITSGDALL